MKGFRGLWFIDCDKPSFVDDSTWSLWHTCRALIITFKECLRFVLQHHKLCYCCRHSGNLGCFAIRFNVSAVGLWWEKYRSEKYTFKVQLLLKSYWLNLIIYLLISKRSDLFDPAQVFKSCSISCLCEFIQYMPSELPPTDQNCDVRWIRSVVNKKLSLRMSA